jgi:catechol 2,3-dioxygenase-like lactoylglutathione lyase family enzyme
MARTARRRKVAARAPRSRNTKATVRSRTRTRALPDRRTSSFETLRLRSIEPILTVSDIERSIRFYTNMLGFIAEERYTDENGKLQGIMLKAGVCRIGLTQDDWKKGRDRERGVAVRIWCTTVQDIDAFARRVKASGHPLAAEPADETWGGRSVAIDDPDGFHITLYHPR